MTETVFNLTVQFWLSVIGNAPDYWPKPYVFVMASGSNPSRNIRISAFLRLELQFLFVDVPREPEVHRCCFPKPVWMPWTALRTGARSLRSGDRCRVEQLVQRRRTPGADAITMTCTERELSCCAKHNDYEDPVHLIRDKTTEKSIAHEPKIILDWMSMTCFKRKIIDDARKSLLYWSLLNQLI
jgi:hypothetical protein